MVTIDLSLAIFRIIIQLMVIIPLLAENRKKVMTSTSLILFSMILFLCSDLLYLLARWITVPVGSGITLLLITSSLLHTVLLIGYFLLLMFFESFDHDDLKTTGNVILGNFVFVFSLLSFIISLQVGLYSIDILGLGYTFEESLSHIIAYRTITALFLLYNLVNYFLVQLLFIIIFIRFIVSMRRKIKQSTNSTIRPTLIKMFLCTIALFISLFIDLYASELLTIALVLIAYFYVRNGPKIFQFQYMRRLILINNTGIPLYSYTFQSFKNHESSSTDPMSDESLFSGALTAIGMLMKEFMGSEEDIKEISFSNLILTLQRINEDLIAILIKDIRTRSIQDSLDKFAVGLNYILEDVNYKYKISTDTIKLINELAESIFGIGMMH
ncbi:MAG: hypothetical protein INQ03_14650 [Candidatus Heimdallarchaeota archaeon]|nr:hypothetical protein [Candidatus Heimdallarchaeota archaeon]